MRNSHSHVITFRPSKSSHFDLPEDRGLPFGGSGKSGNDRPAGVTATLYCTVAQAHLESDAAFDPEALPPGMPRP